MNRKGTPTAPDRNLALFSANAYTDFTCAKLTTEIAAVQRKTIATCLRQKEDIMRCINKTAHWAKSQPDISSTAILALWMLLLSGAAWGQDQAALEESASDARIEFNIKVELHNDALQALRSPQFTKESFREYVRFLGDAEEANLARLKTRLAYLEYLQDHTDIEHAPLETREYLKGECIGENIKIMINVSRNPDDGRRTLAAVKTLKYC